MKERRYIFWTKQGFTDSMNGSIFWCMVLFLSLVSCSIDDKPKPPAATDSYQNGLMILNEGLYQQNNASLCFYSFADQQVYTQAFFTANGRGLGDTANDFELYTLDGTNYIIIAVDVSSQVEIVEANTLKSVAQIPLFDGSNAREPRRIIVHDYAAYVCCFDGTVAVIDLTTHELVKIIQVGANPDGLAVVGNELFVSNSGGLNFPVYDSTVSVINLSTREVQSTFTTRMNCTKMIVDTQQDIYLLSNGNYGSVQPALLKIDPISKSVSSTYDLNLSNMTQVNDWIYYYENSSQSVKRFNMLTDTVDGSFDLDLSTYSSFSNLQFVPELNTLFCFDANGYVNASTIRAYSADGIWLYEFTAELNAKKLIYHE